jgi:hypothetical protein
MTKAMWAALLTAAMAGTSQAQDFVGPSSVGSSEQLYPFDDQESWKHGYLKEMPYYHGYHSFRPYNYHHVYSQSQTASGWGMNPTSAQSQQFWHKYEQMASPGSPMYSQNDRPAREDQLVQRQLQNQTRQQIQHQYNGTSYTSGFGSQTFAPEVSPVVYQGTMPNTSQGPLFNGPNLVPQNPRPSLSDAQREEMQDYLSTP